MKEARQDKHDAADRGFLTAWLDTLNLMAVYASMYHDQDVLGTGINRVAGLEFITHVKGRGGNR